ncbi:MAG: hydantoinase B/oxoprolinase family protein [Nitrospiraceae bacterium]|nr:MAG: hydantoinase B/oxoprolinase family protein [Nitrospiraceae bacterium]
MKWKFAVDRGGTFTDVVGVDPAGRFHSLKLLSHSSAYKEASIEGIRRILALPPGHPLPEDQIEWIRFGTTIATNALLERKGGKVALIITKGFADLLEIGYQSRPDIFSLCIKKPSLLYSIVYEVEERMDHRGNIVEPIHTDQLSDIMNRLKNADVQAVAVVLLHSWTNPDHELCLERALTKNGFDNIYLSHKSVNLIKVVSRGLSTLVDAYLSTVLMEYMCSIRDQTRNIPVEFMQSSGILTRPAHFSGKSAILSGPAGGVVAVGAMAKERGISGLIGIDMGGTSTDVCRYEGRLEKIFEKTVSDIPIQTEMLDIVTVAAGGGSILKFNGQRMIAGPESAGADPGPACYGLGGPLSVTDANLVTGRIIPTYFPERFGADRISPLDLKAAEKGFSALRDRINFSMGTSYSSRDVAMGFLRVSNEKMAMAIKEISVSRGFDVRNYGLVCFGGAGGQHACSIATLLGIDTVLVHPLSSVMSAYGIGLSRRAWKRAKTVLRPFNQDTYVELMAILREIETELIQLHRPGNKSVIIKHEIDLRPKGSDAFLTVECKDFNKTAELFTTRYKRLFGFTPDITELEAVNVRTELQESVQYLPMYKRDFNMGSNTSGPVSNSEIYYPGGAVKAPVYLTASLEPYKKITGPAYIIDRDFTLIVDPGFSAEADDTGVIILNRVDKMQNFHKKKDGNPDPVLLEVFNNLFMGIASEMGITLKNTSFSVNIKERLDFSCALFDAAGNLIANAPHIPVHLGSMSDAVKDLIHERKSDMHEGDMYLTNSPYHGGSHLPDLTVISPVYSDKGKLMFFTAARGHHSDIGGATPGSMPPQASHIDEEGVLIHNFVLVRKGSFREAPLRDMLLKSAYPVRNINERLHDFRAQIAACRKGISELENILKRYGPGTVTEYMAHVRNNAEYSVKKALKKFVSEGNEFKSSFEDFLDDGTRIRATVKISAGNNPPETVNVVIDFSGTGRQHVDDNLNAPEAISRSAVLYVMRALTDEDIPLNSGCLNPVVIIIPEGTILSPVYPAPVASGNVETSQRIVDVLLGAFGAAAASQGTMNNLLFEAEGEPPYYETIAGGSGATDTCDGASGVQVHMTNTRMTDPEILEYRHPGVRLKKFIIRRGSGGRGRFRGGDGVIREMQYLKPATVSIISERREYAPYGINGGEPGQKGINYIRKSNGKLVRLKHREMINTDTGDSIIIETPGGGGYGEYKSKE